MFTWLFAIAVPALYFATPLVVGALGELVIEKAGVVNIGIEGMMLAGALAAWAADAWHGAAVALIAAMLAAGVLGVVFAIATLGFAADQIVTGTGINLLAYGATAMVYRRMPPDTQDHVLGMDKHFLIGAGFALAIGIWLFFGRTRAGLELAAIGESPRAADSAGIRVNRRRFGAVLFGSACAGLAGAYLSIMFNRAFTENMTGGIGFLALALVIFGRWNAWGVLGAGLFFGFVRALGNSLQTHAGYPPLLVQSFDMLPYIVSLLALAGVAGRSQAPAALGIPYARQR
jgi:simple sugar transport system permease protein